MLIIIKVVPQLVAPQYAVAPQYTVAPQYVAAPQYAPQYTQPIMGESRVE